MITNGGLLGTLTTTAPRGGDDLGSGRSPAVSIGGSSAVRLGDPITQAAPPGSLGSVKVTGRVGPTVIGGGDLIIGPLACTGNDPAPTNNGFARTVTRTRLPVVRRALAPITHAFCEFQRRRSAETS